MINFSDPSISPYLYIAIPSTVICIFQVVATFLGADSSDGIDADFDGNLDSTDSPFQLFTLRNLINFLVGFSWTGITLRKVITSDILLGLTSLLVGLLTFYLFYLILKKLIDLTQDNSFDIGKTLNKTAEVYLTIPSNNSGKGKVLISVKGSMQELPAITENQELRAGDLVIVKRVDNNSVLVVEKK